ncbi:hypothetical protein BH23PLA1_BH23PLA1_35040 [soil metagenome]
MSLITPTDDSLSPADLEPILQVCDRFEADWHSGRSSRIERELEGVTETLRTRLLKELLALELELRFRQGDRPQPEEYLARFPGQEALIASAFPIVPDAADPVSTVEPAPDDEVEVKHVARNLLFGLLALQYHIIDQEALLRAIGSWLVEKGRPIGAILVERGDLSPERHETLSVLVTAHLRRQTEDPSRSIAALSVFDQVQEKLKARSPRPAP